MGKSCLKFEKEFAKFHKSKFATLFNSGGSANLAMIQVLKNQVCLKIMIKLVSQQSHGQQM